MLPPVRAALSSTADYQSQAQAAVKPARAAVPSHASQSQQANEDILSSARLDAASLSAQLKLAQGSSILAETIGKLLKTPRRENETLIDYTARLFEAVQALKPQEIANVERLLNQIVKGISLRLMAEILKEPSGPAAARLAAHIEAANIAQRDLATKNVVSFYRQNASADPPLNSNSPRMSQANSPAVVSTSQAGQAPAASSDDWIAAPRKPTGNDASVKTAEAQTPRPAGSPTSATSTSQVLKPDQMPQASRPADSTAGQTNATNSQITSGRPDSSQSEMEGLTRQAMSQAAPSNNRQPSPVQPESNLGKPNTVSTMIGNQAQVAAGQAAQLATAAEPEEMQALARTAVEMFKLDMPVPARLWSALSDQTLVKLANWLATALSEINVPETANLPASSSAAQTAADEKPVDQQRATGSQNSPAPSQSNPTSVPSQAATGGSSDAARMAAPTARADTAEQQMAIMAGAAGALPAQQAREILPWPYVAAYPPGEDEPRQEQRKAEPIEAIEDEEQDGSSQQHAFGDEQQQDDEQPQDDAGGEDIAAETMTAAEKAAGYKAGEARIEADAPEARPSDLYWRMAGWT